jgi:hypothetical protein
VQRGGMANAAPLLTPDLARCHVLRVGVRAPAWGWDDLAGDSAPSWLGHPTLPFETDDSGMPQPVGDDVPVGIRRMSAALSRVIAEVLAGRRPAMQLSRWLDDPQLKVLAEASRVYRRTPPTVASIRLQLTVRGSYEVTLRLQRGRGFAAAAFRLDKRRDRWRCTALVVGP